MAALAMPMMAEFRDRLVPEWPIHAELLDGYLVVGRVDAVGLDNEGRAETVFNWKSDIAPDLSMLYRYRTTWRRRGQPGAR